MKTFRHILTYLQAALLIGLATACRDDLNTPSVAPDVDIDTGISIRIPNLSRAADFARSRAEDPIPNANIIADEGAIYDDDLWLFIYNADGNKGYEYNKAIQIPALKSLPSLKKDVNGNTLLDANGNPIKDWAGAYKVENSTAIDDEVRVPLYPGNYKVYVVANLHEYLGENLYKGSNDELEPIDEATLNQKVLDFAKTDSSGNPLTGSQVLKPGHLPMVCFPEDVETDVTGAISAGVFNILSNDIKSLKCNLNFLCAKVRYTVLFDNTDGGFSNEQFGSYMLDFGTANTITNVRSNTAVTGTPSTVSFFEDATKNRLSFSLPLDRKVYPTESGRDYPKKDSEKVSDLPAHTSAWGASDKQRAWQGTIYIPENPEKSNDANRTQLHLDGTVGEGGSPYNITLIKDADGQTEAKEIERGKFYDLTILATKLKTTEIKFTIKDWTRQQLIYDLHGPYFLEVGDTENVSVESGEPTYIYYDTNAEKLDFRSATYTRAGGTEVPIYEFKEMVVDGERKIRVTINGAISAAEGKKITDETKNGSNDYNYFHVIAGNIAKKITVNPLSITTFLDVEPGVINIDVRSEKMSGQYSGAFPIAIRTNYDEYTITAEDWTELTESGDNDSELMYLAYKNASGNYVRVNFGEKRDKPVSGTDSLYLVYTGLNDPQYSTFWSNDDHSFKLKVVAKSDDGTTSDPETVKINTKRASDNYVIYLRANWTLPHIYVYQCLSFPMDASSDRAGKSLATSNDGGTAALEYSFTGKLAFKGWNVGEYNSPDGTLGDSNGFKYFTNPSSTWDPKADTGQHYYTDYDFCQEYRNTYTKTGSEQLMKCGLCASETAADNTGYNKLWPGIAMQEVYLNGNKWWKFELTAVATPGKALIMFSDGHSMTPSNRYPGDKQVGIPLFDYPDRTGWFDLQAGKYYFQSADPYGEKQEDEVKTYTYRIYWQHKWDNVTREYIYLWGSGDPGLDNICFYRSGNTTTDGGDNMDYLDFTSTITPATMSSKLCFIIKSKSGTDWTNKTKDDNVAIFQNLNGRYESYNTKPNL